MSRVAITYSKPLHPVSSTFFLDLGYFRQMYLSCFGSFLNQGYLFRYTAVTHLNKVSVPEIAGRYVLELQ